MASVAVDAIRKTDPMFILKWMGRSSRDLLIQAEAYDTVQQITILPIQKIKAAEMETRERRMVRMPNRGGEEEGRRIIPESSSGMYVTASVKVQRRFIRAALFRAFTFVFLIFSSYLIFRLWEINLHWASTDAVT